MKLKTVEIDGKKYAEVDTEGRVMYDNDGKEFAFDAAQTYAKIQQLTSEAAGNRKAKDDAEARIAELSGKLEGVDLSKMVDAGKLEEVKAQMAKQYDERISAMSNDYNALMNQYNSEKVSAAFANSQYIKDNLNLPPEVARATFQQHVKIEDGKMIITGLDGQPIYSRKDVGSPAGFDEAMSILIDGLPYRDQITKPRNHKGTGGDNDGGQGRKISLQEFDSMSPMEQAKIAKAMQSGEVALID